MALERFRDRAVDIGDGFQRAFPEIAGFIFVAQFAGFVFASGGAAGNGGAADAAIGEENFGFNGGVATGIQNFDSADSDDAGQNYSPVFFSFELVLARPLADGAAAGQVGVITCVLSLKIAVRAVV